MSRLEMAADAVLIVLVVLLVAAIASGVAWAFQRGADEHPEPSPMGSGSAPGSAPPPHPGLDDETNAAFAELVGHEAQLAGQLARIWTRGKRKAKEKTT